MTIPGIWRRTNRACQRRLARWLCRRPLTVRPTTAIVSFTFDDFPRSALTNGASILEDHGLAGTFYAALGLAGKFTETGRIFELDDLSNLLSRGHELGCHTYDHCPAWETSPKAYHAGVRRNADALDNILPGAGFHTHSYPINHPRPATKRLASRYFRCCRAGGQTFNTGTIDLNHVSAFFLEQSRHDPAAIKRVIQANARERGWLIFATHDICPEPTRFGVTAALFADVVEQAVQSGARVVSVNAAFELLAPQLRTPASTIL